MKNLTRLAAVVAALLAVLWAPPAHAANVCSVDNARRWVSVRDNVDQVCDSLVAGVGAKNGTGVTVAESGSSSVHKTVLTLTNVSITVTDTGGAAGAQGSTKLYDFSEGVIVDRGCVANLTTLAGAGGITDTAALVASLGTTAAAAGDSTLTTTEADWIASFAGTLTAGAGTFRKFGDPVATSFDGHTTAIDLYLNVAVPDAGVSANDTLTVNGTITCTWTNNGDW